MVLANYLVILHRRRAIPYSLVVARSRRGLTSKRRPGPDPAAGVPLDARAPELLRLLALGVAILDADLRPRYRFPLPSVPGQAQESALEQRADDLVHPDDVPTLLAALGRVRAEAGRVEYLHTRARSPEYGWAAVEISLHNYLDSPDIAGILVCVHDVDLRERERRVRRLVEESPVGMYECDAAGFCLYVNPAWSRMTGMPSDVALGDGWVDAVHPEDRARVADLWRDAPNGFAAEYRFLRPDGTSIWVSGRAVAVRDANGEVTRFIGTTEDVTARRRAAEVIAASEMRMRSVVENSSDMVAVVDEQGTIAYVSPAVHRMLGHDPATIVGSNVFDWLHPDDVGHAAEAFVAIVDDPEVGVPIEIRARHADGSWRDVEIVANNLLDDPLVGGLFLSARDLSERRRLAANLSESEQRFQHIFDQAAIGMNITTLDGRYVRVNKAFCQLVGYSAPELLTKTFFDLTHPDDLVENHDFHAALVTGELTDFTQDKRFLRPDGSWVWARVSASVMRDDEGVARFLTAHVEDITDRLEVVERLAHDATHDTLTGLATRPVLQEYVERALDRAAYDEAPVALLMIDLDRFKQVNDMFGHAAGDEVLRQVAARIKTALRPSDLPVRHGGDEFVVCAASLRSPEVAIEIGDRLVSSIAQPYRIGDQVALIGASVGIALSAPGTTADRLLGEADHAVYRAKERGGGRAELYDRDLARVIEHRLSAQRTLDMSLGTGRLDLVFSPIVDLATMKPVGFDCRFDCDGHGNGNEAMALLEHPARALRIDIAMLRALFGVLVQWQESPPGRTVPGLSAALSSVGARSKDLIPLLVELVESSGVNPNLCWLGIPESAFATEPDVAEKLVDDLTEIGFGVGLRHFGARVSSLEHLRRLTGHTIVLDGSLTRMVDAEDATQTVVAAVLRLAATFDVMRTAEDVETLEQARRLCALECQFALGPAFGPPLRLADVPGSLNR